MTKKDKVAKVMHEWKAGTLTSNGKVVEDYDQAVAIALSEAGLSKKMEEGAYLEEENALMVANNNKQIAHHTEEMEQALKDTDYVPAWVVAKVNRSASDLSDATHYLEGQEEEGKYAKGGGIEEEVPLRAYIDGDIYEVIGVNHKLNKVRAKNFSSGKVIEMPINKWIIESFERGTPASFMLNGREVSGEVVLRNGQPSISLYRDNNYAGDAERIIPMREIDIATLKPFIKKEMFDKGGDIKDADDFIENVKEMHEAIDYIVLKDGTKVNGYDIMREGGEMNEYSKGGNVIERRYVNKEEDYETRYAKDKPMRKGYNDERMFAEGGGVGKKLKGYRVDVFTSSLSSSQNVLNGDSYILVTDGVHGDSSEVDSDEVYLKLVKRKLFGKEYVHAEPINVNKSGNQMFGGKFVWSTDSRFREDISEQPIQLHDRFESYAVGGEIGNTVSFKGDYGTPRSGVIKEKRGSSYIVGTDDGDRLVDSYEVISFSETPIAKKKRFGFFEGGGSIESSMSILKKETNEYSMNKYGEPIDEETFMVSGIKKDGENVFFRFIVAETVSGKDIKLTPSQIFDVDRDEKFAGGGEIENKIEKLKKVVSSKMLPESVKAKAQAEIDKLEKQLHESKETKAEEKAEHKAGGSEAKEDLIEIAKKMATERGLRPTNIVDELDAIRTISSIMANESGFSYSKVDDLGNNEYIIEIVTFNEEKKKKQAGMVLNKYKDGTYEVAEMQAGKDGNFIKVFGEYKNLKPAVAKLLKGNKQKPMKVIDMRSPSQIKAEENKMTGESEGERKAGMDEEEDYIEAKTKALEKSLKDKTISETQRKRDEKELALFKGSKEPKFKIGDVVGLDLDERTPKKITSFKTNRKGEIIYSGYYIPFPNEKWNYEESEIVLLKTPSKPEAKKPTTRKAPVKKAVVKKAEVKKEVETPAKPKADHKKLVAKLKAKKGDKEYDNRASINVKTGERYKRSESSDKKREALPLGKRVSADGSVYYENRLNRGDLSKKDKFEDGGEVKGSDWGLNLNW